MRSIFSSLNCWDRKRNKAASPPAAAILNPSEASPPPISTPIASEVAVLSNIAPRNDQQEHTETSQGENLLNRQLEAVSAPTHQPRSLRQICGDYLINVGFPLAIEQTAQGKALPATIEQIAAGMGVLDSGDTKEKENERAKIAFEFQCRAHKQLRSPEGLTCVANSEEVRRIKESINANINATFFRILDDYVRYCLEQHGRLLNAQRRGELFFKKSLPNENKDRAFCAGIDHTQISSLLRSALDDASLLSNLDRALDEKNPFEQSLIHVVSQLEKLHTENAMYFLRKMSLLGLSHISNAISHTLYHCESTQRSNEQKDHLYELQALIDNRIEALKLNQQTFPTRAY